MDSWLCSRLCLQGVGPTASFPQNKMAAILIDQHVHVWLASYYYQATQQPTPTHYSWWSIINGFTNHQVFCNHM